MFILSRSSIKTFCETFWPATLIPENFAWLHIYEKEVIIQRNVNSPHTFYGSQPIPYVLQFDNVNNFR